MYSKYCVSKKDVLLQCITWRSHSSRGSRDCPKRPYCWSQEGWSKGMRGVEGAKRHVVRPFRVVFRAFSWVTAPCCTQKWNTVFQSHCAYDLPWSWLEHYHRDCKERKHYCTRWSWACWNHQREHPWTDKIWRAVNACYKIHSREWKVLVSMHQRQDFYFLILSTYMDTA